MRKFAHVAEYGVFAVLVLRLALFLGGRRLVWNLAVALTAALLLALLDEGRQGLLSNRTGSLRDVGLDVTGGAAFVFARDPWEAIGRLDQNMIWGYVMLDAHF